MIFRKIFTPVKVLNDISIYPFKSLSREDFCRFSSLAQQQKSAIVTKKKTKILEIILAQIKV